MALHASPSGPPGGFPETLHPDVRLTGPEHRRALVRTTLLLSAGTLLLGTAAYALTRKKST
jgi:hypothetical protein